MGKQLKKITLAEAYKLNSINLAMHHKKFCKKEDCGASLILFREMVEGYGIKFSKKELEFFM